MSGVVVFGTACPSIAAIIVRSTIGEPTNIWVAAVFAIALRCAAPVDTLLIIERAAAASQSKTEKIGEQNDS